MNALASESGRADARGRHDGRQVTLWDVASRSLRLGPFSVSKTSVEGLSISADGTMLATAGRGRREALGRCDRGGARPGRGRQRRRRRRLQPGGPARRDRARRVSGPTAEQGGVVEVWDVTRRSLVTEAATRCLPADVIGYALAFTPDGRVLASGGLGDRFVHLWDVEKGRLLRELEQNVGGVHSLEFSPDGRTLAVGGYGEPYAALFDVATGSQIGPRLTAGRDSATVDVSPDGRSLLQTHGNGEGAVWDIDPESWAQARVRARQPHAHPRGVGGVPAGAALRAGLRRMRQLRGGSTR